MCGNISLKLTCDLSPQHAGIKRERSDFSLVGQCRFVSLRKTLTSLTAGFKVFTGFQRMRRYTQCCDHDLTVKAII